MAVADVNEDLLDYKEEEKTEQTTMETPAENGVVTKKQAVKGTYVAIHSRGFRDFLLKPEILRAIVECNFEHPSEVQHECIPQAFLGMDILCQAVREASGDSEARGGDLGGGEGSREKEGPRSSGQNNKT